MRGDPRGPLDGAQVVQEAVVLFANLLDTRPDLSGCLARSKGEGLMAQADIS
jgi:hypothetical protein